MTTSLDETIFPTGSVLKEKLVDPELASSRAPSDQQSPLPKLPVKERRRMPHPAIDDNSEAIIGLCHANTDERERWIIAEHASLADCDLLAIAQPSRFRVFVKEPDRERRLISPCRLPSDHCNVLSAYSWRTDRLSRI